VATPYLYLVVPCYNEAERLKKHVFSDFAAHTDRVHLVFVDDGSSDSTASVLNELRVGLEDRISVVSYPENRGKAEAVRAGIIHALNSSTCRVIGYWDADLATPLSSVCRLANILEANPEIDLVFGSRVKLCGRNIHRQPSRHYLGRVFATAVSIILNLVIYDTQCGAKLFRVREDIVTALTQPFITRWIFDVEILARLIAATSSKAVEARTYEYPLESWHDVSGSKVRPKDFLRAMVDVIRLKRCYL
jgi:glycosyltransferase involved in cell wall biosynthesis